jgi:hypothetical protein
MKIIPTRLRPLVNSLIYTNKPKWISSPEYAKNFNGRWHKVFDKQQVELKQPIYFGKIKADLNEKIDQEIPEMGVLELDDALIYSNFGWIFSKQGHFMPDHSWFGKHFEDMRNIPRFRQKGKILKGVTLTLASEWAAGGYGHFVVDALPRLELFRLAGFSFSDVDHIILPKPTEGNASRLFDHLNIPMEKVVWINEITAIRAEKLLAPTFPGTRRNYQSWVANYLRNQFTPSPSSPTRRLYISRAGYSRNPKNFAAVEKLLLTHNFEIYDPMANIDSHLDFSQAEMIVGASGSGLTGIAFCQPGTKVLELITTDHVYPYYYTLSNAAELEYGCLFCQSTNNRGTNAWGPSHADFIVDEAELNDALIKFIHMS